ncbi:peptide deformylase [Candidatus Saccharibacteria bacterium]|nr:peptide deformylase [Candidatus Saccharibacteria bacterium]NCU40555.1 peptide deformylase [Candidatus Saccharibacteria bacterium]
MTKDDIIILPHPSLHKQSERIHVITDETRELINDMKAATLDWEDSRPHEVAVALAAVQINRLERVVIVRADFDDKDNKEFIPLINPEIIKGEGTPTVIQPEGCLSVRDLYGSVPRYPKVRVKAIDENGHEIRIKAEGFLSMLLQHEIDHTKGICFVDHIRDQKDAFYTLTAKGDLEPVSYDFVESTGIFRD